MLVAGTVTLTWVAVEAVGAVIWVCDPPSVQFTVEICEASLAPLRKLVPVTVIVNAFPATTQVGDTEVTVGMGLAGLLIINVMVLERPLVPVP
jgi:hypothetical protein